MSTLRAVLTAVIPLALLAVALMVLFYVGLIKKWWY